MSQASNDPLSALLDHRVLVCAGAGGVGKTTASAALSVAGARRGKRVVALTVDPAKRLADSLGVSTNEAARQHLTPEVCRDLGIAPGSLSVIVLDPRQTLFDLVQQLAPDPAAVQRIRSNPLFQYLADSLAGANEFMAMEKLLSVLAEGDFDLLVLDTPPSRHALDFLSAPERMIDAVDGPVIRSIARAVNDARRFSINWVAKGTELVVRGISKLTGAGLLEQMATLIAELNSLFGGFQSHAERVSQAFRDPSFGYVLITRPVPSAVEDTRQFVTALKGARIQIDAIVANAVHTSLESQVVGAALGELAAALTPALLARVRAVGEERVMESQRELVQLKVLHLVAQQAGGVPLLGLPNLAGGVPNLRTLAQLVEQFQPIKG